MPDKRINDTVASQKTPLSASDNTHIREMFRVKLGILDSNYDIVVRADEAALARAVERWSTGRSRRIVREPVLGHGASDAQARLVVDDFGRLTREMLAEPELLQIDLPVRSDAVTVAARAWPSGFCIYAAMIMVCRDALGLYPPTDIVVTPAMVDVTTWHSIRENFVEDSSSARPFLAYLMGFKPVWHDWAQDVSV